MNTWARKSFKVGVLSAGALLFAGTAANAASLTSVGNVGIGNGTQTNTVTQAPVDVCGNAVSLLGVAQAQCVGGSWASEGGAAGSSMTSAGNVGLGNGTQTNTLTQTPTDTCGNGVGVLGLASAQCVGGAIASDGGTVAPTYVGSAAVKSHAKKTAVKSVKATAKHSTEAATAVAPNGALNSFGNVGIGNGTQTNTITQLPIDICGNAIGVLGNAQASCVGGATASNGGGAVTESTTMNSGFNVGIGNGTQANTVVQIPVNVCGNAIGLLGTASASCVGGSTATTGGGGTTGGGNGGYGYEAGSAAYAPGVTGNGGGLNSFNNTGIGNGTQVNTVTQTPTEISGNAIGILGNATASSVGGAFASN